MKKPRFKYRKKLYLKQQPSSVARKVETIELGKEYYEAVDENKESN